MKKIITLLIAMLLIGEAVQAQTYESHFDPVNTTGTELNMPLFAFIYVDNTQVASTAIELAAFIGDELRGKRFMLLQNGQVQDFCNVQVYGQDGESVTSFIMFDHASQTEYALTLETPIEWTQSATQVHLYFSSSNEDPNEGYPWVPENQDSNVNASLYAVVHINGVELAEAWEVGAFDTETGLCYGDVLMEQAPFNQRFYAMPTLYPGGNELTFKLYDKTNNCVFQALCTTTITYENNAIYGSFDAPIVLNFVTEQYFEKDIDAWTTNGGWYLVATPIGTVDPTEVENMIPTTAGNYDLYYFDQNTTDNGLEWINYKGGAFDLEPGKGYLYANKNDVTLKFKGYGYAYEGELEYPLTYDITNNPTTSLVGWNLLGNPFAVNAYPGREFYVMDGNGEEIITANRNYVEPMEGIFVVAVSSEDNTMTFSTTEPAKSQGLIFNLKQNGNVIDRAIVRLEGDNTLPKIQLNPNHTKLYIPQDDKNYAVTSINRDFEEALPLNLEVAEDGTYTLSVTSEVDNLEYLTLLDNKTGMQANLLLTPNYQFNASVNDAADRFTVFFRSTTDTSEQFNPILYRNNGLLTVNGLEGEYELQVVDVLGRILSSTTAYGEYSHDMNLTPGLYTIRLLSADKTYTKKIVVD